MHAQHMDIILIFARTRDVGLCRPCLHEKKTDMEQFGKILIVDDEQEIAYPEYTAENFLDDVYMSEDN